MRGKGHKGYKCEEIRRITPAHAGKRCTHSDDEPIRWDHPRACGEKCACLRFCGYRTGSPPRMRGKVTAFVVSAATLRITPAHAGKRECRLYHRSLQQDHPRACGEKLDSFGVYPPCLGSPPRMRGKGGRRTDCRFCMRITPAHAGKRFS